MNYIAAHADTRSLNAVTLQMAHLAQLSQRETEILQDLPQAARHHPSQTKLCSAGRIQFPLMLLSGWACYYRTLRSGERQIIRFILPGDAIGSLAHPSMPAITAALALTPVVVADARPLLRATDEVGASWTGLAEALAATTHIEEASLYDQVVRLGRQTSYERLLHLTLELHDRLRLVGLVDGDSFLLPLTQQILADALGLSVVHLNRMLQQARQDKLLELRRDRVTLLHLDRMRVLADWAQPMSTSGARLSQATLATNPHLKASTDLAATCRPCRPHDGPRHGRPQ